MYLSIVSIDFQKKIRHAVILQTTGLLYKLGLKKNIVCFRFPTDPIKTCATQIYFMDFQKKKKKKKKFFFFFFFFEIHKLRDDLLAVVKVTKKTLRKGKGGSKNVQKTKNHYIMYR